MKRKLSRPRALAVTGIVLMAARTEVLPVQGQTIQVAPAPAPASVRILIPDTLDTTAASVAIQYPVGGYVELRVNGVTVPSMQIGRTETDSAAGTVTQTWYGVILHEGANTLTALATTGGPSGSVVTKTVQVRTAPQQLVLHTLGTHVPADGRSLLTITGRLLDAQGHVFLQDGLVTLAATSGEWVGTDAALDTPGFQVWVRGGLFSATLRAGLRAQTVHIRASAGKLEAFTQAEFTTDLRPSLVTGVLDLRFGGRSTDFYRSFEDFLPPPGVSAGPQFDGYASLFATGRVGDSLFTGAYNSQHALNETFSGQTSLGRDTQQSDQQYPLYGDGSVSEALAQSRDNLYLRVERDHDYALWGDYNTSEFASKSQQLTATTRALHALKGNYQFGAWQATGFYGDNVQGFQRDTIAPDGTSGYYFLSHRPLVYGSENVVIEEEELVRPGTVVSSVAPQRGVDYEIDYDRGTVLFHQPVVRTDVASDGTLLTRRIVITYQYETGGSGTNVYGGRLQYHLTPGADSPGVLGATFVRQNQGLRTFNLYGLDGQMALGRAGTLTAEYGRSDNVSEVLGPVGGSAYRLEASGPLGRRIHAGAYWRSTSTGYANDATTSFVPGQTRYGAQASAALSAATQLRFQLDHEDNKGLAPQPADSRAGLLDPGTVPAGTPVDNSYQSESVGVQQQIRRASLSVDWIGRQRTDHLSPDTLSSSSEQLQSRLTLPLSPKLTFQARNDTTLSSGVDAVYPDATQLGLNWTARPGVSVGLNQQYFGRGQFSGHALTSLDTVVEHKFGDGADMSERFSIGDGANGFTIQQALGLNDRWAIAPGLHLGVGYEHIMGGLLGRTAAGPQYTLPYTVGQSASSLGVVGGDSRSISLDYLLRPDFKASARYEMRTSSGGSNTVFTAGAAGKIGLPLTALFQYQQASSSNAGLEALGQSTTLRLGMAYRDPRHDQFNGLLRYEYRVNPAATPASILLGSGTGSRDSLFAVEGLYAPEWQWEFYGKFAVRDSASYLASDYVGGSSVALAQARTTYRFRYNMDVVGEARWVSQSAAGYQNTAATVEAGYYLSSDLRLAAGYTFGHVNDPDFTGSRSAGGFSFGLTAKVNNIFHGFGIQKDAFGTDK